MTGPHRTDEAVAKQRLDTHFGPGLTGNADLQVNSRFAQ